MRGTACAPRLPPRGQLPTVQSATVAADPALSDVAATRRGGDRLLRVRARLCALVPGPDASALPHRRRPGAASIRPLRAGDLTHGRAGRPPEARGGVSRGGPPPP